MGLAYVKIQILLQFVVVILKEDFAGYSWEKMENFNNQIIKINAWLVQILIKKFSLFIKEHVRNILVMMHMHMIVMLPTVKSKMMPVFKNSVRYIMPTVKSKMMPVIKATVK